LRQIWLIYYICFASWFGHKISKDVVAK